MSNEQTSPSSFAEAMDLAAEKAMAMLNEDEPATATEKPAEEEAPEAPAEAEAPEAREPEPAAEKATEKDDDKLADLDNEIAAMQKEYEERVETYRKQQASQQTPQETPSARPAPPPSTSGDEADIDPDMLTEVERTLYTKNQTLERELSKINQFVERLRQEREEAERSATIKRATDFLEACQQKYDEFKGDDPLAKLAREKARSRMLFESDEPPQLIAARIAKEFREIRQTVQKQYLEKKLQAQSGKTHGGAGRAPAQAAPKKTTARDLIDGTATDRALALLRGM